MSIKQLMIWPVITFALAYALIFSVSTFAAPGTAFPSSWESGPTRGGDGVIPANEISMAENFPAVAQETFKVTD